MIMHQRPENKQRVRYIATQRTTDYKCTKHARDCTFENDREVGDGGNLDARAHETLSVPFGFASVSFSFTSISSSSSAE